MVIWISDVAHQLSQRFLARCEKLGFNQPHIARLSDWSETTSERLTHFVDQNYHGQMAWMKDTLERRRAPQNMWPEAKSAILVGLNYGPDTDPLINLARKDKATISVYAQGKDYHDIMKGRLKELAGLLARDLGADVKVFVDTAPLMEKPLAELAGLGWQGKHTNLVSRDFGSWLFIGSILTDAELPSTQNETDHCGSCTACLDICPTDAFPAPYQLDARKCISYLTIEHKGPVDPELRSKMGNRIYGCDDCLAVCPWNKYAQTAQEAKLKAQSDPSPAELTDLLSLTDIEFRKRFSGSTIKRIGRNQFIRNVLYAIGNSEKAELREAALPFCQDEDPVIADAARWAVRRLGDILLDG